MSTGLTIAEQRLVESHLRALTSLDCLRRLFADLGYQTSNEPVSTADWEPEPAKIASDGHLRIIAQHQYFVITHCHLQELTYSSERKVVTRLIRCYEGGLFVFSNLEESLWHLVNVKQPSRHHSHPVLRHIIVNPEELTGAATERISLLRIRDISLSEREVELIHDEAFDVVKFGDRFYRDYKASIDNIVDRLQHRANVNTARVFARQFMSRMMFLCFLQKKGWLGGQGYFISWLWQKYRQHPSRQSTFYKSCFSPVFLPDLRSSSEEPAMSSISQLTGYDITPEVKKILQYLPVISGRLFARIKGVDDQGLDITDSEFDNLLENLFEYYSFTINEDTPLDMEIAVNPEMLGKVYEQLVDEKERGHAGVFYTPRVDLDFMCRLAIIEYLDEVPIIKRHDLVNLVMNTNTPESLPTLSSEALGEIQQALERVTIVDPACGSGAFLVGMIHILSGLHRLIGVRLGEPGDDFQIKKRIIEENLFGVDIKEEAAQVTELRLWLSLISSTPLEKIREASDKAIPRNLVFNIRTGDCLTAEIISHSHSQGSIQSEEHFSLWDAEFARVFRIRGGFDIVIGNPPYVSYKYIVPPNKDPADYTNEQWQVEVKKYKASLRQEIQKYWGKETAIRGFSDYYVYFYLQGLALVRPQGILCFVTSSSWLDTDYGADLQQFLLTRSRIKYVFDNISKRSFAASDVNTAIVLLQRPSDSANLVDQTVRFVACRKPFDHALTAETLILIEKADSIQSTDTLRVYPISQKALWEADLNSENNSNHSPSPGLGRGDYAGDKWGGKYIRAPDIYFKIMEKGQHKLRPLGMIARIVTGVKAGGYSKYITRKERIRLSQYSSKLSFILKNTACHPGIEINSADSVITGGSQAVMKKCATLHSPLLWLTGRGQTHKCHLNSKYYPFSGNYIGIEPYREDDTELLAGILNSTLVIFISEIMGRDKGIGGSACVFTKSDLARMPIPDPAIFTDGQKSVLIAATRSLAMRPYRTLFQEVGLTEPFNENSPILAENMPADRRALDNLVFASLKLTENEQVRIYHAVVELFRNRIVKAGSS